MDIALLRQTFDLVKPRADDVARAFYARLLGTFPQVRPLFADTDFDRQRRHLIQSLAVIVAAVDHPEQLTPVLDKLGQSHVAYRVEPHMYRYVSFSLLATLADALGDAWTPAAASTWESALDAVSAAMIDAQARHAA